MSPDTLLLEMSQELGIKKARIESEDEWKQRIILSAGSAWLLESIRSAVSLSVTQIRSKLSDKVSAYFELFQPDITALENTIKDLVDYIYNVHTASGSFYHKAYYIYPAKEQVNNCCGIKWYRAPMYPLKQLFSGMGTYTMNTKREAEEPPERLFSNYLLPSEKPDEILNQLIKKRQWRAQTITTSREFLNVFRQYGEGYYTAKPLNVDDITLSKELTEHGSRYILVHRDLQYDIRQWEQEEGIHEYVALTLMQKYQQLNVQACVDNNLVKINLNYALPGPEESFLRLYAWPNSLSSLNDRWNFWLTPDIYPVIKNRLHHLGFIVMEETV